MHCARKHTVVTGCSSGIGRATALRLAAAGQHVYAGVRNPADGDQLARSAAGGELTPLILDVTDTSHIAAAAAAVTGHTGTAGLHGLVNNAGFGLACPTELVQLEAFRRQLEVNVIGQLAVTQAFLPSLRRARGRIVMVSTIGVRFTPPFAGPLDATKAALSALGDALRQELAPWGVRVVVIEPASINSGAADKVFRDAAAARAAAGPRGPRPVCGHVREHAQRHAAPRGQRQPARRRSRYHHPGTDCRPAPRRVPDRQELPAAGHAQQAAHTHP